MKKQRQQSGFTLVESLVSITLIILAITGSYEAARNGVVAGIFTKDQITSFYLAQEGIEQIRNRRDTNALQAAPNWLTGITASGGPCSSGDCKVDAVQNTITSCGGDCGYLNQDSNGFFTYGSGTPTKFKRTITVTAINANEVSVQARIDWAKGVVNQSFTAKEYLMNWQ